MSSVKRSTTDRSNRAGADVMPRILLLVMGAGLVIFSARLMFHRDFMFYNPVKRAWISVLPVLWVGYIAIYWGLRRNRTADRTDEEAAPEDQPEPVDNSGRK